MILFSNSFFAQNRLKTEYFYPKDSVKFNKENYSFKFHYENKLYGKTTMIIRSEDRHGEYFFVFKKKIFSLSRIISYKNIEVSEVFNLKTKKWEHEKGTWEHKDAKGKPIDTTVISKHNIYAFVLTSEKDRVLEKVKFQDFGNEVYWPEFDYVNCLISDENSDEKPEFYLSYLGESDGLDAEQYKQIIYAIPNNDEVFTKSKATAYYPAGNEEDVYKVEYDENWKSLPKSIQIKSKRLLDFHRKKYE